MNHFHPEHIGRLVRDVFEASGSSATEAAIVADHLVEASLMGHDSHGVMRAAKYIGWLKKGFIRQNRHAKLVLDRGTVQVVDGGMGYGQVIGLEAMRMLADRSKEFGIACLAIRNCAHLGRIGKWAEMLAEHRLVSVHYVNTTGFGILVAPHGGSDRRLSANPIAAGAPRGSGAPIILDFATSVIAEGKVQMAYNKGEALPEGAVLDGVGNPTREAKAFYANPPGAILPFAGHKGYGISVFCELLAGALTGSGCSNPGSNDADRLVNNLFSIAIDPEVFGDIEDYSEAVTGLETWVKGSPPQSPDRPVLFPGDIERRVFEERQANGLPIDPETMGQLIDAARNLGVEVNIEPI